MGPLVQVIAPSAQYAEPPQHPPGQPRVIPPQIPCHCNPTRRNNRSGGGEPQVRPPKRCN
jgi:hypothetical protein